MVNPSSMHFSTQLQAYISATQAGREKDATEYENAFNMNF